MAPAFRKERALISPRVDSVLLAADARLGAECLREGVCGEVAEDGGPSRAEAAQRGRR